MTLILWISVESASVLQPARENKALHCPYTKSNLICMSRCSFQEFYPFWRVISPLPWN